MCILCEIFGRKHVERVEPQEGMRGYNEEFDIYTSRSTINKRIFTEFKTTTVNGT